MDRAQLIEQQLRASSPLEVALALKKIELYDKKESQEVFDEVYQKFENGDSQVENVLKPVMLSIVDSLLETVKPLRDLRSKGLTASRIWTECENFSYENTPDVESTPDAYQESKNIREKSGFDGDVTTLHATAVPDGYDFKAATGKNKAREARNQENQDMLGEAHPNSETIDYNSNRTSYEDKNKMAAGTDEYFGNRPRRKDEYRDDYITKDTSSPDHIIPLTRVHDQFQRNNALNTEDMKQMANQGDNFAITDRGFNKGKNDQLNEEMETFHGEPLEKYHADKQEMKRESEKAQTAINQKANEFVAKTLTGEGNVSVSDAEVDAAITKQYGKNLSDEERKALSKEMRETVKKQKQEDKAKEVYGNLTQNAVSQSSDYALGNFIIFILKPIVYEMKDIIKKGLEAGVAVKGKISAIKKRFTRVKDYILENGIGELWGMTKDFVKMLISSFIEGVINLFIGFYKMVFKIVKEGVKIFVRSYKIIWGEEGKNMTSRQKGDAVLKLVGAAIGGLIGIGVEQLLSQIVIIPGWARMVLATLCSGLLSALFMNTLEKLDLFSVKSEKRQLVIEEVFNARIKDVESATESMDTVAIDVLNAQQKAFNSITSSVNKALDDENYEEMSARIKEMSSFLKIELPYGNVKEFIKAYDTKASLSLD
ncbi:MAG: hypothetical protein Q4D21_00310 [Phascolarctobacterium sp.]|nr:hypothetical protein [Phascolarctobacterium sp.]